MGKKTILAWLKTIFNHFQIGSSHQVICYKSFGLYSSLSVPADCFLSFSFTFIHLSNVCISILSLPFYPSLPLVIPFSLSFSAFSFTSILNLLMSFLSSLFSFVHTYFYSLHLTHFNHLSPTFIHF